MWYSIVEQAFRDSLDELPASDLFANYSNADILESVDEVAYRCELNDFSSSFSCMNCGEEFCVNDPSESDGICEECHKKEDEPDEDEEEEDPTESRGACPKCGSLSPNRCGHEGDEE